MLNSKLKKRAIEIAYKHRLSHLGSTLTSIDPIKQIYSLMGPGDTFVLDNGHAYLAQCVVMESLGMGDAEVMYLHHGTHPDRCPTCHVMVSSGSLGLAGAVAAGLAYHIYHDIYVLTSDGALQEGIWYETLSFIKRYRVKQYKLFVNANGYAGNRKINICDVRAYLDYFRNGGEINLWDTSHELEQYLPVLDGQDAHYKVLELADKNILIKKLSRQNRSYEID